MLPLISATPSHYARKNRIALLEKDIPFDVQGEILWERSTQTPKYNLLEKLPIFSVRRRSTANIRIVVHTGIHHAEVCRQGANFAAEGGAG